MIDSRRTSLVAAIVHGRAVFESVREHRRAARLASDGLRLVPRNEIARLATVKRPPAI